MKNVHLIDEILQAYILNDIQDDAIVAHLAVCPMCQKKLEEYQLLIASVEKIEPESFSFDVSSLVMTKIIAVETRKEKNENMVLYMSLSAISIVAMVFLYPYLKTIFTQFKSFSFMGNAFMVVSALGIAFFLLSDLLRQYKQKEMLLTP